MQCKRKDDLQVWKRRAPPPVAQVQQKQPAEVGTDGFREVVCPPRKTPPQMSNLVNTKNSFRILAVDEVNVGDIVS